MRKIVAGYASSLDGYILGPHGEIDWIVVDKEVDFSEQMKRFDTFFYGRKTYEEVIKKGMAYLSPAAHYVFSNSLSMVTSGFMLIKGNISDQVSQIKERPGKDIAVFGGANLLASLLDLHLVDEISVSVLPVLLGGGKPMVDILNNRVWLSLLDTKTYGNGTIRLSYTVKQTVSQ
jgi:dihydrofolate reductase